MPRFLIEVPHADDKVECALAIRAFLETGSHFLTNADWGCCDGVHKAWFVIEASSKAEARLVVPPSLRPDASATELVKFTMKDVDEVLRAHQV
jgi:hypothetical protein